MSPRYIYLVLSIASLLIPWILLSPFFYGETVSLSELLRQATINDVATSTLADLFLTAVVAVTFMIVEGRSRGMRHVWIYIPLTFLIGVAFALALFLFISALPNSRKNS